MSTIDASRRYLERLKKRRQDPFYQQQASWLIKKEAPEFRYRGRQYEQYLESENAPETAKAQALQNQQQNWAEIVSGAVEPARIKEEQRRKALEGQIEEGEYKIDVMEEQKKEQEKARKRNFWKNMLKAGGTLAAVATAPLTGGASLGMKAAIGGLVGSVAGEAKYGKEYYEPAGIVQGMNDISMEIVTGTDLKIEEAMANQAAKYSDVVSKMTAAGVSDVEIERLIKQAEMNQGIMSPQKYIEWADKVFGIYYK